MKAYLLGLVLIIALTITPLSFAKGQKYTPPQCCETVCCDVCGSCYGDVCSTW